MAKKIKHPWMKFFTSDWLGEPTLRIVSPAARGLWIDMLCYMHQSPRRGYLLNTACKPLSVEELANMASIPALDLSHLLDVLKLAGVYSCTNKGVIYSRRMVRETSIHKARSKAGSKGGNASVFARKLLKQNTKPSPEYGFSSSSAPLTGKEDASPEIDEAAEVDAFFAGDPPGTPATALRKAVDAYCDAAGIPATPSRRYHVHSRARDMAEADSCGQDAVIGGLEWGRQNKAAWQAVQERIRSGVRVGAWVKPKSGADDPARVPAKPGKYAKFARPK